MVMKFSIQGILYRGTTTGSVQSFRGTQMVIGLYGESGPLFCPWDHLSFISSTWINDPKKKNLRNKGSKTFEEAWDKDDTELELAMSQGVMRKSPLSCIQESSTRNSVILTSGPTLKVFWIDVPLTESTESISPPFSTSICKVIGNSACPYPVERWSEDENRKFPSSNWTFNVEGFLGNIFLRDLEKRGLARLPFPRTE